MSSIQPTLDPSPNTEKEVPGTEEVPGTDWEPGEMPMPKRKKRNTGKRDDS